MEAGVLESLGGEGVLKENQGQGHRAPQAITSTLTSTITGINVERQHDIVNTVTATANAYSVPDAVF